MTLPALDFETYSEAGFVWNEATDKYEPPRGARSKGLPTVGASVYTEHPSCEVLTASYDLQDGHGVTRWRAGDPPPQRLFDHLARGGLLEAHNAMFEYLVWTNVCVTKYGWPSLDPYVYQLRCSMAKARVASLPGALGNLADVLGTMAKDKEGKRLLDKFSIPRNPTKKDARRRITPAEDPADGELLALYCDRDIIAEGEASAATPPMTDDELIFWLIDQEINRRGIAIDRPALRDCMAVLEQALDKYGDEFRAITGGLDPTQLQATKGWLAAFGVHMDAMDEDALDAALARMAPHPPGGVYPARRVLEIRQLIGSASVKKLYAMEHQASRDDRLRNLIIHHGARTGRPTGEGPQPLNLPRSGPKLVFCAPCAQSYRPSLPACPSCGALERRLTAKGEVMPPMWTAEAVDGVLDVMAHRSLELVEYFFGDALLCISGCLRGLFVAAPGHDLIASDFSAIEAVVIAMLAGEQWRIDAFRENKPIYLVGASKITGTPLEAYLAYYDQHGEHHSDRQTIGKVSELACFTPQTLVLTRRGYVPIVAVRKDDQLWDGVEWVSHQGVVAKGRRHVIDVDGVKMTPDHLVNCKGFWTEARQLASSAACLSRGLATGSANLPFRTSSFARGAALRVFGSPVHAAHLCTAPTATTSFTARPPAVVNAPWPKAPLRAERTARRTRSSICATRTLWPIQNIAAACSTASARALRGVALTATPTTAVAGSAYTRNGSRIVGASSPISLRCPAGISPRSNSTASIRTGITLPATSALSRKPPTRRTNEAFRKCSGASTRSRPVFDIAFAGPRNRFTIRTNSGHLIVHNCGFGGWIGSYKAFGSTEPDDVIKAQILAWRAASPAIVELWGGQYRGLPWERDRRPELFGYEGMAVAAIQNPGEVYAHGGVLFFMRDTSIGPALIIRLLSGRELTYHQPRLFPSQRRADELSIVYMTWNSNPKYGAMGWGPMETYGGRLTENIVQATAHDILRHSIVNLRAAGYPTVLHVYDEIVGEIPQGTGSLEQFEAIMATMPAWAADWPIRASGGWRGRRYRKG